MDNYLTRPRMVDSMDQSEIDSWMALLQDRLLETFGDRVVFVGLQGSHARGEATEGSDKTPS